MKKQNMSWLDYALQGTGIGFPVTALCLILIGGWSDMAKGILIWMAASALFGLFSGLFFTRCSLSLPVATGLHFLCCLAVAAAAGWLCGYTDSLLALATGILPLFLVIYVVLYLLIYFGMKREEKRINQALEG